MRFVPENMQAALESGVSHHAHVWRIERRDGVRFGFTDHDRVVVFDDVTYEPALGASIGAIEKSLGLAVDSASFAGALSSALISADDLSRGLWDGARVDIYKIDWRAPEQRVHLFSGRIGEVRRGAAAFEAELRGLQAPLNTPVGRVFSRYCDADLGDARCGVDLESDVFRGEGEITHVLGPRAFRASGLEAFPAQWLARGRLVWAEAGESEIVSHQIGAGGEAVIELAAAPIEALSPGAAFTAYAGCDKRHETCRAKFANMLNFRGFPHMPGNDAIQAGPDTALPMDGGSRFA